MPVNQIIDTASGDGFATAQQHGPTRLDTVFDGDNTQYLLEEDYVVSLASFSSLALNTVHAAPYGSYYLVKESPLSPVGCGDIVKWTRTYAAIPSTRNEYSTFAYKFIGYAGTFGVLNPLPGQGTTYIPGRLPFTLTVDCKIVNDYFLVGTGGSYATADAIPVNLAERYYYSLGSVTISGGVATFTPRYTPGSPDDIASGIPTDFLTDPVGGTYYFQPIPTTPTRTAYQALVAAGSPIVVEDSSLSRWQGNIFCRVTKTVIAR